MRTQIFRLVTLAVALVFALAGAEAVVRIQNAAPPPEPTFDQGRPVLQEPDPELGWRNKAGRVEWPGLAEDAGKSIQMTFWPDGLRATAPERRQGLSQVIVLGCSYTQGWAVTDEETYAWKLQQAFPSHAFLNYGTAGYGTYQSLLALERHLAGTFESPELVIYGFVDHHETRNVAPAGWLHSLATASRAGPLTVPFVTVGPDGKLERHRPEGIRRWPLTGQLASFALLEDRIVELRTRARAQQGRKAAEALLLELQRVTREHGARLLVVLLEFTPEPRAHYAEFLARHGIEQIDCMLPQQYLLQVPGYGHPDRRVNAHWASCISERLARDLTVRAKAAEGAPDSTSAPSRSPRPTAASTRGKSSRAGR